MISQLSVADDNGPQIENDPLTLELARLLGASEGKDEDSPEVRALEAFMLLLIERERLGLAS